MTDNSCEVAASSSAAVRAFRRLVRQYGLSPQDGELLLEVAARAWHMSATLAAQRNGAPYDSVRQALARLCKREFLENYRSADDPKVVLYRLGPEGRAFLVQLAKERGEHLQALRADRFRPSPTQHAIGAAERRMPHPNTRTLAAPQPVGRFALHLLRDLRLSPAGPSYTGQNVTSRPS